MDNLLKNSVAYLQKVYKPHTIIVYGSRATGDATSTSDIDIACFCDKPMTSKDARLIGGMDLDAWIYATEAMNASSREFFKLIDGYSVLDEQKLWLPFHHKIAAQIAKGPNAISNEDRSHKIQWIAKMLKRVQQNDVEALYRKNWLAFDLLETYFEFRNEWYFGPKKSFQWLEIHDPEVLCLFKAVYAQPDNLHALNKLAKYITH